MIEVRNICKRFRTAALNPFKKATETVALDDVGFHVDRGQVVALVGRNGAGKSTLMKILCTVVLPDRGQAVVNGFDVMRRSEDVRRSIGYSGGDERSFYWRLSGRQNLVLFAALQNVPRAEIKERVDRYLSLAGLESKADIPFRSYSTGMRQRLALARSLLHDPPVLMLDEPNKGLDPLLQDDFKDFLKNKIVGEYKKTVLMATHDLEVALDVAHRVAFIHEGKLLYFGRPDNAAQLRTMMRETTGGQRTFGA